MVPSVKHAAIGESLLNHLRGLGHISPPIPLFFRVAARKAVLNCGAGMREDSRRSS